MGERRVRNAEAGGSTPLISTTVLCLPSARRSRSLNPCARRRSWPARRAWTAWWNPSTSWRSRTSWSGYARELLVTTLYPLRDNPQALADLIPQLAAKGLVGLAITPDSYVDRIPPEMIRDADRLGFPLLELPQGVVHRHHPASHEPDPQHPGRRAPPVGGPPPGLPRPRPAGWGFADIAGLIAEALGRPVAIVDRFRRVLGWSSPFGEESLFVANEAGELHLREDLQVRETAELGWEDAEEWQVAARGGPVSVVIHPVRASSMDLGQLLVWGSSQPFPTPSAWLSTTGPRWPRSRWSSSGQQVR